MMIGQIASLCDVSALRVTGVRIPIFNRFACKEYLVVKCKEMDLLDLHSLYVRQLAMIGFEIPTTTQDLSSFPMEVPLVDISCLRDFCSDSRVRRQGNITVTPFDVDEVKSAVEAHLCVSPSGAPARATIRGDVQECADALLRVFKEMGFAYISNYQIDVSVETRLDSIAREFFQRSEEEKLSIAMSRGGRAWRGFFPVGGELTNGKPDVKEGIYFGQHADGEQLGNVGKSGVPLHGENVYPGSLAPLENRALAALWQETVEKYMCACEAVGQGLMVLLAIALRLPGGPTHFLQMGLTRDPLGLFRIFHYPPPHLLPQRLKDRIAAGEKEEDGPSTLFGVGEHTDYGLITLLRQDNVGGLQVRSRAVEGWGWIDAPPRPNTLVVNVGDMLEALTQGLLMSTPHRVVRNSRPASSAIAHDASPESASNGMRVSMPYFFDPSFSFIIQDVELTPEQQQEAMQIVSEKRNSGHRRWDAGGEGNQATLGVKDLVGANNVALTYGEYLSRKVSKVFPALAENI